MDRDTDSRVVFSFSTLSRVLWVILLDAPSINSPVSSWCEYKDAMQSPQRSKPVSGASRQSADLKKNKDTILLHFTTRLKHRCVSHVAKFCNLEICDFGVYATRHCTQSRNLHATMAFVTTSITKKSDFQGYQESWSHATGTGSKHFSGLSRNSWFLGFPSCSNKSFSLFSFYSNQTDKTQNTCRTKTLLQRNGKHLNQKFFQLGCLDCVGVTINLRWGWAVVCALNLSSVLSCARQQI